MKTLPIDPSWAPYLGDEFNKPYIKILYDFLKTQKKLGKKIYPATPLIFESLNKTPFNKVKAVILGQDPYHGPGQAHGLSFSVNKGVRKPPSLVNIFKELSLDLNIDIPEHGCLESWTNEGVLLLNNVLTVEDGKAASHQQKGWEIFTDKVIESLNQNKKNLVFILWGSPAQKKAAAVDSKKHLILKSVHPSPLSSYRGFFGSKPFSKTNQYLKSKDIKEINWEIV